jgi:hypothetical protein
MDYAGCGWCGKVLCIAHATYVWHGIPFCTRQHETKWQEREMAREQARCEITDRLRVRVPLASQEECDVTAG